jgi:hypothetical protein
VFDWVFRGGALLDAGSCALSVFRLAMVCAPQLVVADTNWVDSGVDFSLMATLNYADGRRAHLSATWVRPTTAVPPPGRRSSWSAEQRKCSALAPS